MKHVTKLTRPEVSRAQANASTIMFIIGSVMTAVGSVLITVSQSINK
ncbi:MAG TPA: hypothetical protein PKV69_09090 [Candidatus Hydrogenedentes bacterium]|nr:hypothetical protein [Candidatus Hydrogenedentota bacterium]